MKHTTPEIDKSLSLCCTSIEACNHGSQKPCFHPISQLKKVYIAPDPKYLNLEASITPNLTCMDSKVVVSPNPKLQSIRFPNAADPKSEKLEALVTPDPKSDVKLLNWPGFVRKKICLHISKDNGTTAALIIEKSNMGMQLNNEAVAKPRKLVRRQLNFGVEDYIELVSYEKTIIDTDPNLNKSSITINLRF